MRGFLAAVSICAAAAVSAACGGAGGSSVAGDRLTVLLDRPPNAVHSGLYLAVARGYDEAEGAPLTIRRPGRAGGAPGLLRSGRADLAILGIHELGLARERGADLVGVMAMVQRPLAAVLAQPAVRTPTDLEGRRVGVTGLPSDDAVLAAVVRGAGGDPDAVRRTTVGSEAVPALLSRRVAAATAFWSAEGVALRRRRPGVREFRVDEFGAPAYPELVLATTRSNLDERRAEIQAAVRAMQRGYEEVIADPESALAAMLDAVEGLDRERLAAELTAVTPAFEAGSADVGRLDAGRLEAWARWDVEFGILERAPDVGRAFDFAVAGGSGRG